MSAPQLDPIAQPAFPSIRQDVTNPAGITVAQLVVDGSITTSQGGAAPEAIAINRADNSLGTWQYSLDSGSTWIPMDVASINRTSDIVSLLLGPTAMVRMVPSGEFSATLPVGLTFLAWDGVTGTSGSYVNILQMGADAPYSWQSNTVEIAVTPVPSSAAADSVQRGFTIVDFHESFDFATGLALRDDGGIFVVGESQLGSDPLATTILSLSSDGSIDTSFAQTGKVIAQLSQYGDQSFDTLVQSNGKLLVFGAVGNTFSMTRYTADGQLDTSFGDGGVVLTSGVFGVPHAALEADGEIVVVGTRLNSTYDEAVMRFTSDGSPDLDFNGTGRVSTDFDGFSDMALDVKVLWNGGLAVLGSHNLNGNVTLQLSVYHEDGSLDTAFNGTGKLITSLTGDGGFGSTLAVQPDGKILVAGFEDSGPLAQLGNVAIVRYNADGTPDASFGANGTATLHLGRQTGLGDLLVQADGKILFAGSVAGNGGWDFGLARFNSDGTLDTTFNGTGMSVVDLYGFADEALYSARIQPDGKIVVLGTTNAHGTVDNVVARFTADGQLDSTFGDAARIEYTEGSDATPLEPGGVGVWDSTLAARDGNVGNYAGATLTVSRKGGISADDHFSPTGELTFVGSSVLFQGVVVGTFTTTTGQLAIAFNSNATQLRVNGVASHLAYSNSSEAPPTSVELNYVLTKPATAGSKGEALDAAGDPDAATVTKITGTATVRITSMNDAPTGGVSIAGFAETGQTLTASHTLADADGLGAITYQWFANGEAILGVIGTKLTLSTAQLGKSITVTATYTDGGGFHESVQSQATSTVIVGASPLTLTGTAAGETLSGNAGRDLISGLAGNDTLIGFGGDDTLDGGAGTDRMDGGADSDLYLIAATKDHTAAEIADSGVSGTDEMRFSGTGTLKLFAGDTGLERVVLGSGTQSTPDLSGTKASGVNAAAVTNALWIVGNAATSTITGTAFDDTIDGGAGADRLKGGGGNDTYYVDNTKDVVTESSGEGTADRVVATASYTLPANVEILVLAGNAAISGTGTQGNDKIYGNSAANVIDGKGGLDVLDGGDGSDIYLVGNASEHGGAEFADTGLSGTDEVRFTAKSGTLVLAAGDYGIERVVIGTGSGVTAVTSAKTATHVDASAVGNGLVIIGNAGTNSLKGTSFADTLTGGLGNDTLTGGNGADTFVFDVTGSKSGFDTVTDFAHGVDELAFSRAAFTALGATGALAPEAFWAAPGATSAHDADDRIVYDSSTGKLYYDADGLGGKAGVQVALLGTVTHPVLDASDIVIIS